MADDPEWTLAAGDLRCVVSPFGASLRRLWQETPAGPRDLIWGYSGTANKKGGQGDVLAPFPGRMRDGGYTFSGARHQLDRNDKAGPNAIHGFVRNRLWEGDHDARAARFRTVIKADDAAGYPFRLELGIAYELATGELTCAFVARNLGDGAAPFGIGFHPYIVAEGDPDSAELGVPASRLVELEGLLPTGAMRGLPGELDFRVRRRIGGAILNHCFTGLARDDDGFARVRVGEIEVWMGPAFPYLVLYTGDALGSDARKSIAVEPMTCATDAFNNPALGLKVLQSGESFAGSWGIAIPPGAPV